MFVPWTTVLPGFRGDYVADSSNVCVSGAVTCVDAVIAEMQRRFEPLASACSHHAVFSLTYLRTTEEYRRSAEDANFFTDPPFINHQDALFAKYYFDAWDAWRAGNRAAVPKAWEIALDAADRRRVSGTGNLLLGMSAHVNRDLPYVLAEIGLIKADGSSRKVDHDKVNEFLNRVIEPLLAEASRRFDPTIGAATLNGTTMDETASLQMLVGWREEAWRNAERLVAARTPSERAAVEQSIEAAAARQGTLIVAAAAYPLVALPLVDGGATTRDRYCAAHWNS